MKVVCIFPITNNADKMPDILKQFKLHVAPGLQFLGASNPEIKFAGTDYVFVAADQMLEGEPKGKGILECLKNVPTGADYVICCDGSHKIPYKYIVDIFQALVSDSKIVCVMANRVGNKGIDNFRYLIERFEIFALCKYHNYSLQIPDGQCGLWGYKLGEINVIGATTSIKLTAVGYDIELDLLGEVLENKLPFLFVNIELSEQPKILTSFQYRNNLGKMKFLCEKYSHFDTSVFPYLAEFEKSNIFSDLCDSEELKERWKKYKEDLPDSLGIQS